MKGRPLAIALALLLTLGLLAQTRRCSDRVRASTAVAAVRREMLAVQSRGRAPGWLPRIAGATLAEAMRRDPVAIEPHSFRGDLLLLVGRPAEAVEAYERAAAHELRAEILFHQGIALWELGRQEEGVVQMRRGVALAPHLATALPPNARELVAEATVRPLPPR